MQLLALLVLLAAPGDIDPNTGLVDAPGAAVVAANCSACHSLKLVTQNRGTAADWLQIIRWMQRTQNLWALDPVVEQTIVAYLGKHFAPQGYARRPPLHPSLMPSSGKNVPLPQGKQAIGAPASKAEPPPASPSPKAGGCGCQANEGHPASMLFCLVLLGLARHQYSTGSGSKERQRYHVATVRNGRQGSASSVNR